jgi:hypothetical protein
MELALRVTVSYHQTAAETTESVVRSRAWVRARGPGCRAHTRARWHSSSVVFVPTLQMPRAKFPFQRSEQKSSP